MRTWISCVIAIATTLFVGCSLPSYVTIRSLRPAQFNIGAKPNVVVVEAKGGRRNNQDIFIENLIKKSRDRGVFVVSNRVSEGIRFDIQDGKTVQTGKIIPMSDAEALLKFELLDGETVATEEERAVDILGLQKQKSPIIRAKQGVSISIGTMTKTLDQKEIDGVAKWDKGKEPGEKSVMVEAALADAAARTLDWITPRTEETKVRLDGSDEAQKPIIAEIEKGSLLTAAQLLEKYLADHPNSASAHYNYAVVMDAMGRSGAAIPYFEKAESLGAQAYYAEAKNNCIRRTNEAEEMK